MIGPFLDLVATQAREAGSAVEMHFERLEHFNSSTITLLINFIREARANEIHLTLVFDDEQRWQRLSFDGLRVFEKPDGFLSLRGAHEDSAAVR